jgi:hypothetical protein
MTYNNVTYIVINFHRYDLHQICKPYPLVLYFQPELNPKEQSREDRK